MKKPDSSLDTYVNTSFSYHDSGGIKKEFLEFVSMHVTGDLKTILDIGAAPGHYLASMHDLFPEASLTGIDMNEEYVNRMRNELKKRGIEPTLVCGSGDQLPFESSSFDLVISQLTMPYLKNEVAFLKEIHRVLKPDGVLWLSTHGIGFYLDLIQEQTFYYKFRWFLSILSGFCHQLIGFKPVLDTPSGNNFLQKQFIRIGYKVDGYKSVKRFNFSNRILCYVATKL